MRNWFHSGDNIVFSIKDVIGVFGITRENDFFLKKSAENFLIRNDSNNKKSFLLVDTGKKILVYYSAVTAKNLIKRLKVTQEEI
ncbi:MAG: hypothetical protein ACLFP1_00640 [Candidatus Goldiibacteriota bacterium]